MLDDKGCCRANRPVREYGIEDFSLPRMNGYVADTPCIRIAFVSPPSIVSPVLLHIRFVIVDVSICLWRIEENRSRSHSNFTPFQPVSLLFTLRSETAAKTVHA